MTNTSLICWCLEQDGHTLPTTGQTVNASGSLDHTALPLSCDSSPDNRHTDERGCAPTKLYLQKQAESQLRLAGIICQPVA